MPISRPIVGFLNAMETGSVNRKNDLFFCAKAILLSRAKKRKIIHFILNGTLRMACLCIMNQNIWNGSLLYPPTYYTRHSIFQHDFHIASANQYFPFPNQTIGFVRPHS